MQQYRIEPKLLSDELVEAAVILQEVLMRTTDYEGVQITFTQLQSGQFVPPTFDVQVRDFDEDPA